MRAPGWLRWLALGSVAAANVLATTVDDNNPRNLTRIHEAGRCAIRGQCGKESVFGGELPCSDNGLAEDPDDDLREHLVEVCGDEWKEGDVCCRQEQVDALRDNFAKVKNVVSSCPACKKNFYDLFCTFTCSPDQSLFVNVTD